jgi:alpha-mannosidase
MIQTGEDVAAAPTDPYAVQTARLSVAFSHENGCIARVTDRESGETLAKKLFVPVCYRDMGDTWCFNIDSYEKDAEGFIFDGFEVIESGEILTEIKGTYRKEDAKVEMYYRFYRDAAYFDVRYRVNFEGKHKVLKLECDAEEMTHRAAVPAGSILRGESAADLPLGAWVRADKFTVCPNASFAYSMTDGKLGLTVLRSPIYGDLRLSELDDSIDYDIIDRDVIEGGLRVSFAGDAWETADAFCNPPVVIDESNHEGTLPATHSFYRVCGDGVGLMALKKCEDGEGAVVRLCENDGVEKTVTLCTPDARFEVALGSFEIKTLRLCGNRIEEVDMIERATEETV